MMDKVAVNFRAFDEFASFNNNVDLEGNQWHTIFTKFSVTNTSVVGFETTKRGDYAKGAALQ